MVCVCVCVFLVDWFGKKQNQKYRNKANVVKTSCSNECFPSSAKVELEDGSMKRMDEVKVGDRVLSRQGIYSEVYTFSHRLLEGWYRFVRLETKSGRGDVSLSRGHYVYVNGGRMKVAEEVVVGDEVELSEGKWEEVVKVEWIHQEGLINPHTRQGDVVVNGVRCSTFTSAVEPRLAKGLLWPVKILYDLLKIDLSMVHPPEWIVKWVPNGETNY